MQALEVELARLEEDDDAAQEPDAEVLIRGAGLVRFQENEESKFLGPSSGIAITRLVMEMAKQNTDTKTIKEVVPDTKAQEIKDRFETESKKPISKVYPHISAVVAPTLPGLELTKSLVENFNQKGGRKQCRKRVSVVTLTSSSSVYAADLARADVCTGRRRSLQRFDRPVQELYPPNGHCHQHSEDGHALRRPCR